MPAATLIDLPTELVLKILHDECISHMDVYLIGLISRRLNLIAIPILLELQGVSNPHDSVSLSFDRDSFPPLHYFGISQPTRSPYNPYVQDKAKYWRQLKPEAAIMVFFHISSIREIQCYFPQSFTDLPSLLRHLERVECLINRLTSVESLTLHFEGDHRYRHLSSNTFSAIPVPFADVFGRIIRSATARGCETLLLFNKSHRLKDQYWNLIAGPDDPADPPHSTNQAVQSHPAGKKTGKVSILTKAKAKVENALFHRHHAPFTPSDSRVPHKTASPYPSSPPSLIGHTGKLQAIHIQTPFALLPRCFPDIRDIMHSSINTLTSLTFSYIIFDEHLFDLCLSSLFLNTKNAITHLSILHCQKISSRSLLRFLLCFHDRLEQLELDRDLTFIGDDEDIPIGNLHFQELHTIKAPLDWIQYLLKQDLVGPPLPSLSALTIQCRVPDVPDFTYEVFRPHLDAILQPIYLRWKNSSYHYQLPRIDVTLDLKLDTSRPLQMDTDRIVLNLQTSLSALSYKDTISAGRILNTDQPISPGQPRPPRHWDLITKLELSPTYPPVNDTQAFTLAQWVTTLFPAVEQVTLPLPFIPRLMPISQYKSRQKDLAVDASNFLRNALRLRHISDDSEPVAWKTLVVGQWSLSLELY